MRVSAFRLAAAALVALLLSTSAGCRDETDLLAPGAASTMRDPVNPPPGPPIPPDPMLGTVVDITSGDKHVCARSIRSAITCWGSNSYGQVGVASTDDCGEILYGIQPCVPHPTMVTGSATVNGSMQSFTTVNRVTAGGNHTCVIAARGSAWCWGGNEDGQLGNGTQTAPGTGVPTPAPVAGSGFTALSAGGSATCGISNATLFCWGKIDPRLPSRTTPMWDVASANWGSEVNVGAGNVCARYARGTWGCWGDNENGQLGMDWVSWPYFPGPIGTGVTTVGNIVSTNDYTCLDDTSDGTVKCLGKNDVGQLGDPTFPPSISSRTFSLRTVGGPAAPQLSHVAMGARHACALDPQGQAFCWGADNYGELGRGFSGGPVVTSPTPVVGGLTFAKLVAGMDHTCGLTTDLRVFCWGSNYSGQLGFPSHSHLASNPTPVQVAF